MEGRILGNRYELIEKIGGGGMAVVYKARCRLLNRYVAVKILRTEFTNDEEFVKRFRIEAQAAASLSHPNIVSIYDVGEEDGIHYIVMEYIDGITLKQYIAKKGALPWREAVNITIQICSAIEQAHRKHIVHRDIKPHNILLTRDGIAKVTDFGIARAASSSTITMVGNTIGSVHYFSPEQARGGYIDEKSDLYSLGIALYEMLTGRVPFESDTPVAVALMHIQSKARPPVEINSDIPQGVNDIVMKAIEKEQSKRYQSASDMLSDLYRVLKEPDLRFINSSIEEDFPTRKVEVIRSDDLIEKEERGINSKSLKEKKRDRITTWLAVITSLIIIFIFGYVGYSIVMPSIATEKEFTVDNYVGRNFDEVKEELEKYNINVKGKRVYDENKPKGVIISQSITAGQKLKLSEQNTIEFEVSDGPKMVKVPELKNAESRLAEAELRQQGLNIKIVEEFSDSIANGHVIRTEPVAGEEVKAGTVVTVYISKGPELKKVTVPDLIGKTRAEAQQLLVASGLTIGKIEPADVINDVAKIIKQVPAANTEVNEGSAVDITFETIPDEKDQGGGDQNTGENQGDSGQTGIGSRKIVTEKINLDDPDSYGKRIKVHIEAIPSDTGKAEVLLDDTIRKERFPLTVEIPVPQNGTTKVKVYLDDALYVQLER